MYTISGYRGDTGGRCILYQDTGGIQKVGVSYIRIQGDTGGRCILYQDTEGIPEVHTLCIYLDFTRYLIVLFSLTMILTRSLIKPGFLL